MTFGHSFRGDAPSILYRGEWCLLPKVMGHVKLVLEVILTKSIAPLSFNLHSLPSFLSCVG
jgi:hypothetical protein